MQKCDVVVSLTSYPVRIDAVSTTINSILNQSLKPEKIILWLALEEFPLKEKGLPQSLLHITSEIFSIEWCENIYSFKKLIPSLKKFSNKILVTADDDLIYPSDWLDKLYKSYLKFPNFIHAHRCRRLSLYKEDISQYTKWPVVNIHSSESFLNFTNSGAGMLIPPYKLSEGIFNQEEFLKICPHGDDIWFWAMALLKGTKIKIVEEGYISLHYVDGTQESSLWEINEKGENDLALERLFERFPEVKKIVWKEGTHYCNRIFLLRIKIYNFINRLKSRFIRMIKQLGF